MIKITCDMCGCEIDYEVNGVNVDFNHYGKVHMGGEEREYQVCNLCAKRINDFIRGTDQNCDEEVVEVEECTQKGGCNPKRNRDKAEENKILSEEAKKVGWKSGVMNI